MTVDKKPTICWEDFSVLENVKTNSSNRMSVKLCGLQTMGFNSKESLHNNVHTYIVIYQEKLHVQIFGKVGTR